MFMHEGSKAVDVFSDKDGIGIALMDGLANPGFDLNRYVLSVNDANVPGPLLWNYLQGLPRERYDIQGDARTLLILRFLFPFQAGTTIGSYYDGNADRVVVPGR